MGIGFLYILKNIHLYFFLALYINSRGYIFYIYKTVPFMPLLLYASAVKSSRLAITCFSIKFLTGCNSSCQILTEQTNKTVNTTIITRCCMLAFITAYF